MNMAITMDIHLISLDTDKDVYVKFHTHGKLRNFRVWRDVRLKRNITRLA